MEQDLAQKIEEQNKKLDAIYGSVEKTRKYFLWTLIIAIAAVVLPIIGLAIVIPPLISTYSAALNF